MNIVFNKYNLSIDIQENIAVQLVVENKKILQEILEDIWNTIENGRNDNITVYEECEIDFSRNASVIYNPLSINLNDKKIINKLYEELSEICFNYDAEKAEINSKIINLLEKITTQSTYNCITYNLDFENKNLFKLYNVSIEEEGASIIEQTTEYIKVMSTILKQKVLILFAFMTYLDNDEINEIIKIANYCKINIIFVEPLENEQFSQFDGKTIIIDKDQCIILK